MSGKFTESFAAEALAELSERIERRERILTTMLSSISDFSYIFDRKGRFLFANQPLLDLWGIRLEEAVGKDFLDLNYPDDLATKFAEQIQEVFASGRNLTDETPYTNPAGVQGFYEYILSPAFADDGTVEFVAGCSRDVTERKRAEADLRESERRQREIASKLEVERARLLDAQAAGKFGSWEVDLATMRVRWSEETFRIFETDKERFQGTHAEFLAVVHPEDRAAVEAALAGSFGQHGSHSFEHRLLLAEGRITFVEERWQLIYGDEDQPIRAVGTCHDITVRKQAEKMLRESEERYRQLIETANEGIWTIDTEGRTTYVNQRIADLLGYTPAEMMGRIHTDFMWAEDRPKGELDMGLRRQGTPLVWDQRYRRKDNSDLWTVASCNGLFDPDGTFIGALGMFTDITERKQAEQATERTLERLNDAQALGKIGDWEWDIATQAITWSPQVFEIHGRDPSLGSPRGLEEVAACYDVPSRAILQENVTRAVETGETQEYELVVLRPSGERVHVQVVAMPKKDEVGRVMGFHGTIQNITERKRMDDALRDSEERFAGAFEYAPVGMALVSPEGRWLKVNQVLCALVGYSEEEMLTRTFQEITHSEDLAADMEFARQLIAGEIRSYEMEKRYIHRQGHFITASLHGSLVRDMQGKPLYFIAQIQDITERKQAKEALQRSEAEFRVLAESMPQIIWVTRPDGWHTHFNQRWLDYTGLTLAESLGHGWLPPFHPEDQPLAAERWKHANDTGEPYEIEYRLRGADGNYRWMLGRAVPLRDEAGGIVKWFGTCTDIHDLKAAELEISRANRELRESDERFNQLADNISDVFWITSPDYKEMQYISAGYERIWGRSIDSLYANPHQWIEAILPEERDRVFAAFAPIMADAPEMTVEYRIARPDGSIRWIHDRGFQVRDAAGKLVRLTGISSDITERKQVEAELKKTHAELVNASRQAGMSEVATNVLHNVGNVLNSVNISCSVVAERVRKSRIGSVTKTAALLHEHADDLAGFLTADPTGKRLPEYIGKLAEQLTAEQAEVLRELKLLGNNIDHIKEIVAMQQNYGRVSGITESISVADLVEDSLRLNEESLGRHAVRVVREFDDVPPVTLEKHKVLQILVNLIRNAKHACTDSGRDDKQINLRIAAGSGCVRVSVIDNGVGIPPGNLTRIFSYGFTTKAKGHGFGLHSGALAAAEMGGSLTVQSDGAGSGATFTLELPSQPASAAPDYPQ